MMECFFYAMEMKLGSIGEILLGNTKIFI